MCVGMLRREDGLKASLRSHLCRSVNEVTEQVVQWVWLPIGSQILCVSEEQPGSWRAVREGRKVAVGRVFKCGPC